MWAGKVESIPRGQGTVTTGFAVVVQLTCVRECAWGGLQIDKCDPNSDNGRRRPDFLVTGNGNYAALVDSLLKVAPTTVDLLVREGVVAYDSKDELQKRLAAARKRMEAL